MNGRMATTPEEAIANLCDAHFPTLTPLSEQKKNDNIERAATSRQSTTIRSFDFLRNDIISKAINTFCTNKAPGLDGITPAILKLLGPNCIELLRHIFSCQLSLQYTPSALRTSKVDFIPKIGKDNYCLPKSYRPISLTPFLFKFKFSIKY